MRPRVRLVCSALALLLLAPAQMRAQNDQTFEMNNGALREMQSQSGGGEPVLHGFVFSSEEGKIRERVVGGEPTPIPFQEAVKITFETESGGQALCSGVAVASDRVLTAGHCGCAAADSYTVLAPLPVQHGSSASFTEHKLSRPPVLYKRFDCSQPEIPQPGRDAAILYLKTAIGDLKIPPAAAMMSVFADPGLRQVMVTGYGRTGSGDFPNGLLYAFSPILDFFCASGQSADSPCFSFKEFVLSNLPSTFAAAKDSCDGDSGGPVYWFAGGRDREGKAGVHRFLIGITSRGLAGVPQFGSTACGGGGIYTAVGDVELLGWLAANGAPLQVGSGARDFALETITDHGGGASPGTFKSSK